MNRTDHILEVAEGMARVGGYDAFSFREIAKSVGIKAASVHYHFPSKEALSAEMTRRYTTRFLEGLGDPNDPDQTPAELLSDYIANFRKALVEDKAMCLGGILGTQREHLPPQAAEETAQFFAKNVVWLATLFTHAGAAKPRALAITTLATLEGAMLVAHNLGDASAFDTVAESVKRLVPSG